MASVYLLLLMLAVPTFEQSTPNSPCPNVFVYEASGTEPGRWYGVVNLSTDSTLHSLWLNIVLDSKADILGNWIGDVTTSDNTDFKIENTKMKIHPGPATEVRFFVQYNSLDKVPRLQEIRLNGREICNANNPLPAINIDDSRPPARPRTTSRPQTDRPHVSAQFNPVSSEEAVITRPVKPVKTKPSPVYEPTQNPPINASNVNPYSIGAGNVREQSVGTQTSRGNNNNNHNYFQVTTTPPRNPSRDDDDKPDAGDYFTGGLPTISHTLKRPSNDNSNVDQNHNSQQSECGKVLRNANPLVVNGKSTLEGQWPWQIALYQTQANVDSKYICGGTLVSHMHVITAAHCVTRKSSNRISNPSTFSVYLGKHNLRTSVEGVQFGFVMDITVHPQYNASSYAQDLSVLTLRSRVEYSAWVQPACLWPDDEVDLSYVINRKGSVVGWGFDDTGIATEELTLVEMPVVDQETCIRSYSEFFARFTSDATYCAGYRDGHIDSKTGIRRSTSVCNGDSGGGMVFSTQNTWYLRGLVSLSVARTNEYRCDPSHYVVFTDLAKFLPWIKQNVNDY